MRMCFVHPLTHLHLSRMLALLTHLLHGSVMRVGWGARGVDARGRMRAVHAR